MDTDADACGGDDSPVIGIGASAGGIEALKALFAGLPADLGAAVVVVTHISPHHQSLLPGILRNVGTLPVTAAADGQEVKAGQAYVLETDGILTIANGRLRLRPQDGQATRQLRPIDVFLASLARDRGEGAGGILLSGSGSDGALGLKAIKENGGLTLAQGSGKTGPAYAEMPQSAIGGGYVDLTLPIEAMGSRLGDLVRTIGARMQGLHEPEAREASRRAICNILAQSLGYDFFGYKDKTFFRRVKRRMNLLHLDSLGSYVEHLRRAPDEAGQLFRDLLIGVTGFFRDAEAFAALEQQVILPLLAGRGRDDTVRVWVPGCSTGEEAYSLAMLLLEQTAGMPDAPRVQVFASDIDEAALAVARAGRYPAPLLSAVPPARIERFFSGDGTGFVVSKALREICIFSTHSVIRDPPFSRMDLVSCRNLLIYLGGGLQDRVLPLFHYALRPGGYLFLGLAETIARHSDLFAPVDKGHRIFRRRDHGQPADIGGLLRPGEPRTLPEPIRSQASLRGADLRSAAGAFVLDQFAPAFVVVNREGDVVHQSARLGKYLELAAGSPSRQLRALARRGLRLPLQTALREAVLNGSRVVVPRVEVDLEDRVQPIMLTVAPLAGRDRLEPLFVVVFTDLGPAVQLERAVGVRADDEGEVVQLERELRETRDRLQATIDEYETASEELKAANEELVSVNEELQSTNEELETSREEQQSVNEELRTVNLELSRKLDELDRANADLRNLFESTRIATIFLDRNMLIRSFTPAANAIINLQPTDRGRPLTDFAHHLDGVDFRAVVAPVLERHEPIERRVAMRDGGTQYLMRLLPYRTSEGEADGAVLTFIDVSGVVEAEILAAMVAELNHRVRNMLQVVMAVFQRTLQSASSLEECGIAFRGRVQAMARAHELVSASGWGAVPLEDLVRKELAPYAEGADRLRLKGSPVALKARIALAVGMVLHELATNASKYGALSVPGGHVAIAWEVDEAVGRGLRLRWAEQGGPPVSRPTRCGFGTEMMERQVRHDLHGRLTLSYAPKGLRAELAFPLDGLPTGSR